MLSSQGGGLCQLLSYCLPAPAPPFHTQLWDARAGPLKNHTVLLVGSQLGSPAGGTRGRLQSLGRRRSLLLGASFLLALVPSVTQQHCFTLAAAVPSCAAAESGLPFLQHLQNHPHYAPPQKHHHQLPSTHSSEVWVSALGIPPPLASKI